MTDTSSSYGDGGGLPAEAGRGPFRLHDALERGESLEVIREIVESDPYSVQRRGSNGWLPLHIAAFRAPLEVVRLLGDAYPHALLEKDKRGWLPLHVAVYSGGYLQVVKYLGEKCPEAFDEKDNDGWLPLHMAARHGIMEVIKYLAAKCPTALIVKDNDEKLPVDHARDHGKAEAAAFLEDARAALDDPSPPGRAAAAARKGSGDRRRTIERSFVVQDRHDSRARRDESPEAVSDALPLLGQPGVRESTRNSVATANQRGVEFSSRSSRSRPGAFRVRENAAEGGGSRQRPQEGVVYLVEATLVVEPDLVVVVEAEPMVTVVVAESTDDDAVVVEESERIRTTREEPTIPPGHAEVIPPRNQGWLVVGLGLLSAVALAVAFRGSHRR